MSCNSCQSKFSFLTRENACPSCGFSFCSKCLKYKVNTVNKKICGPCYNKLINEQSSSSSSSGSKDGNREQPPAWLEYNIHKKLESMDNPSKPPITIYKQNYWDQLKTGLDPQDQAIVDRLMKLKEEDTKPTPPTTEEIQRRLALLKDQDPDYKPPPINIHQVDTRSDQQKTDDLIEEYLSALQLSNKDSTDNIEKRLNILKGIDPSKASSSIEIDADEATVTKNIIKKALAEAELEKKYANDEDGDEQCNRDDSDIDVDSDEDQDEDLDGDSDTEEDECYVCGMDYKMKNLKKVNNFMYCPQCYKRNFNKRGRMPF